MKKIGIITINDYNNYGNRLQNYATQEVVKSLGFEVETIVNVTNSEMCNMKTKMKRFISISIKEKYELIKAKILNRLNKNRQYKRINAFKQFTAAYILEADYTISDGNIPDYLNDRYDFFITGSDQVWNPIFGHGLSVDFLTFSSKHKRIAYVPSFGITTIPDKHIKSYQIWLSEMKCLSVREEDGAKIINELTGRTAIVLVDPTLMLTKEKWLTLSKISPNKPAEKYLLTYFLGGITKETKKMIKQISGDNRLTIVNLADMKDNNRYYADPLEFIDYINSASIFFTNSFHGAVFSIILEIPFIIFDRIENIPSMNSRTDTLLSTFKLNLRKWNNIKNQGDIFDVDYSHVSQILEVERKKALDYLNEALHIKDEN